MTHDTQLISHNEFKSIEIQIKDAINEVLTAIKTKRLDNYILLLANGVFDKKMSQINQTNNPYAISYIDKERDRSRGNFLSSFLNNKYSNETLNQEVKFDEHKTHLELMIYSHIWESKPLLKKLYHIANLDDNNEYDWKLKIPDLTKYKFISEKIKTPLIKNKRKLANIIESSFHSSLRNSFAHSEYTFDTLNNKNRIILHNYKDKDISWALSHISFSDWNIRFTTSALLSYHLNDLISLSRKSLYKEFGTNIFSIFQPQKTGKKVNVNIEYIINEDRFVFVI